MKTTLRLSLAVILFLLAFVAAGAVFLGCTEEGDTYNRITNPCCDDTCYQAHTCDQATGCTDPCSDKYENVWICYKGETMKVPLSEKKEWVDKGATIGKCRKVPPGDDDDDDCPECPPPGDDDDDDDDPCILDCCPTSSGKYTICHFPPGNPDNAHTLVIGASAVPAHLGNHPGDHCGPCQ